MVHTFMYTQNITVMESWPYNSHSSNISLAPQCPQFKSNLEHKQYSIIWPFSSLESHFLSLWLMSNCPVSPSCICLLNIRLCHVSAFTLLNSWNAFITNFLISTPTFCFHMADSCASSNSSSDLTFFRKSLLGLGTIFHALSDIFIIVLINCSVIAFF